MNHHHRETMTREVGRLDVVNENASLHGGCTRRLHKAYGHLPASTSSSVSNDVCSPSKYHPSSDSDRVSDGQPSQLIIVGSEIRKNTDLQAALKKHFADIDVHYSTTGLEYVNDASEEDVIFVLDDFEGETFHKLRKAEARIIGPSIIIDCAKTKQPLPLNSRPTYNTAMEGLIVCFNGFKKREELSFLANLIHHMSGSIRKDISHKVTHLVANASGGNKYRFAVSYGTPIMGEQWVIEAWKHREEPRFRADTDAMVQPLRLKPFHKCCLGFYGFSPDEQKHMEELTVENGGQHMSTGNNDLTHLVIEDHTVKDMPTFTLPKFVVRSEWFWCSIQMEACSDEAMYTFLQKSDQQDIKFTPTSGLSGSKSRKRKRLKENIAQLAAQGELDSPHPVSKRRSSELGGGLSMSPNSFLDASGTPDKSSILQDSGRDVDGKPPPGVSKVSPRLQVVMELLQTEKNYVGILHTIMSMFKAQVEKVDQYNGPLLNAQEAKIIFGNLPPIYEVHCCIRDDLTELVNNWREEQSVGDIILKHARCLEKAYPPFVNFFDKSKEAIQKSDKANPRFHAFLKVCLTKPECGRQSLMELLIRPVQRLPSVMLLLTDILKNTNKSNPDHGKLEQAIANLKQVMTHINEDRRKTEGQVVMFDIVNDIDNCPPNLLSSHRTFVTRVDVIEVSGTLSGKGHPLSLFLFNDSIEICKRRMKVISSARGSPAMHKTPHKTPQRAFKHLELLPLLSIRRVLDVAENEECWQVFGLICRNNIEAKERLHTFTLDSDEVTKSEFLSSLCKNMANIMCRTDFENLMAEVDGCQLNINTTDIGNNTLTKAVKFGKRVSRKFSFNKTPRRLKRAISSISSAFSPFGFDTQSTPGSDLRGRRLASTMDLTDASPLNSINETPLAMSHFDDSETISLGGFSLNNGDSPRSMIMPSTMITPSSTKKLTKYMTLGPNSVGKYL